MLVQAQIMYNILAFSTYRVQMDVKRYNYEEKLLLCHDKKEVKAYCTRHIFKIPEAMFIKNVLWLQGKVLYCFSECKFKYKQPE